MKNIAYITAGTPFSTGESFVLTELFMLKELGAHFVIIPRDVAGNVFHQKAHLLLQDTLRVPWFNFSILTQLMIYMGIHPVSFIRIINAIVFKARSAKIALKNLTILPKSLYLAGIVKSTSVTHIHAHWASTTATMAYIISRATRIPWSLTIHRWDISENNILQEKCKTASLVRTISETGKKEVMQIVRDSSIAHKIVVLHMGVVMPESLPDNFAMPDVFTIMCPANFIDVKGHKYLVDACSILKKRHMKVKCLLAGDGPLENTLKAYVRDLELNGGVQFLGRLPHERILAAYERKEVHAVLLPSIETGDGEKEGIPVALMEAMSYGIPVISTDTGGISELIGDGSGIMIEEKNPEAIADAIERLMKDPAYYDSLSRKGREKIEEEFNVSTISRQLLKFFFE